MAPSRFALSSSRRVESSCIGATGACERQIVRDLADGILGLVADTLCRTTVSASTAELSERSHKSRDGPGSNISAELELASRVLLSLGAGEGNRTLVCSLGS